MGQAFDNYTNIENECLDTHGWAFTVRYAITYNNYSLFKYFNFHTTCQCNSVMKRTVHNLVTLEEKGQV